MHLTGDAFEICKSVLFEMSLRRCMRRLRDASEMYPCRLGNNTLLCTYFTLYILHNEYKFHCSSTSMRLNTLLRRRRAVG